MAVLLLVMGGVWFSVVSRAAQYCNPRIYATCPDSRYTDNSDGTVTDKATGLMWMQDGNCILNHHFAFDKDNDVDGAVTWQHALQFAEAVNAGTYDCGLTTVYTDWRLPNRNELASLVEEKCIDPAINATIFPATDTSFSYWTSSSSSVDPVNAWSVSFSHGVAMNLADKGTQNLVVRLVRTAP